MRQRTSHAAPSPRPPAAGCPCVGPLQVLMNDIIRSRQSRLRWYRHAPPMATSCSRAASACELSSWLKMARSPLASFLSTASWLSSRSVIRTFRRSASLFCCRNCTCTLLNSAHASWKHLARLDTRVCLTQGYSWDYQTHIVYFHFSTPRRFKLCVW